MNKLISEKGEIWTSHDFVYNKDVLNTLDELQISVADLRDLVNASQMRDEVAQWAELKMVLCSIVRKNKLPTGAVDIQ
jgi:4-hydroxy-3-methylbut-2-enyl diphosphate reductase IspH